MTGLRAGPGELPNGRVDVTWPRRAEDTDRRAVDGDLGLGLGLGRG